jgi:type I restriction-modification system DNA methylase subunit
VHLSSNARRQIAEGLPTGASGRTRCDPEHKFFKRISDVHGEEYQAALAESGEEYADFQIPEVCHWEDVRTIAMMSAKRCIRRMRGIEKANPETLYGIFGDAQWTNKNRLSDSLLRDLIEHFSRINLGNQAARADVLGQSYEYLIKKFADEQEGWRVLHAAIGGAIPRILRVTT